MTDDSYETARKLFFLLDLTDGNLEDERYDSLPGLRAGKDEEFAESLAKWYVDHRWSWTPKQEAVLERFLLRYERQTTRMSDDYDPTDSPAFQLWTADLQDKRKREKEMATKCLITDD